MALSTRCLLLVLVCASLQSGIPVRHEVSSGVRGRQLGHRQRNALSDQEQTPKETKASKAKKELGEERSAAQLLMSNEEVSIIETFLKPTDIMLEWGAGKSTTWYSQFVKEYYSIEHESGWYESTKNRIYSMRDNVHLELASVAEGHKGWGGGIEEGTWDQFESYVSAVDRLGVEKFDKVLIDGRARSACAEYILKYLHKDSIVFIHDFQDRKYYHDAATQYYNRVAETYEGQTVIVLRPKREALEAAREQKAG